MVDYETRFTGVGGQGIQLMATTLAVAATDEGRDVLMSSEIDGWMRGGHSLATVVVADEPVRALPVVAQVAAAVAMHPMRWPDVEARLRPGALVVVNETLFDQEIQVAGVRRFDVPATALAAEMGNAMVAGFVMLGAYTAITELVSLDALVAAMGKLVPPYRRQHVAANEAALRAGFEHGPRAVATVWPSSVAGAQR
jgi:2-oxoglutarate ferredoxin oxidoreductase subunit gamma